MPNVPPIATSVAGFDWPVWQGVVAPAGTPKEVVDRLSDEVHRIQATPEFREQLFRFGMESSALHAPGEFAAIIKAEQPRWAKAVKDSGAKVD
jgi:tripartite-type tricarboxylate transporter receptor subunit TctC